MPHLIVVFLICTGLGYASGSPGIAYVAMCAELFVSTHHAADKHKETTLGWLGSSPNAVQGMSLVGFVVMLGIDRYWIPFIEAPWFWPFGVSIAVAVGTASHLWHISVHIPSTLPRHHNDAFGHRALAFGLIVLAILAALIAPGFPLTALPA